MLVTTPAKVRVTHKPIKPSAIFHKVADGHRPVLQERILDAMGQARAGVDRDALARAFEARDPGRVEALLGLYNFRLVERRHIRGVILKIMQEKGDEAATRLLRMRNLKKFEIYKANEAAKQSGVMVALVPPAGAMEQLQRYASGDERDNLHMTLVYLGKLQDLTEAQIPWLSTIVRSAAHQQAPLKGLIQGVGRFNGSPSSDGKDVFWAHVDMPGLNEFRQKLVDELRRQGLPVKSEHGFTPHITLAYIDPDESLPVDKIPSIPFSVDRVLIKVGDHKEVTAFSVLKGDVPGHPFHGNQWTDEVNPSTGEYRQKASGPALSWPKTEAEFKGMRYGEMKGWDKHFTQDGKPITKDTPLIVFHATDPESARLLMKYGFNPADKPSNLARQRYESGQQAEFAPGRGVGQGLYIGSDPNEVNGYGRAILAIRTTAGQLEPSPEQASLGSASVPMTSLLALKSNDAQINGPVPSENIRVIAEPGKPPGYQISNQWAALQKGDVPGHEFHGNQWTGGGARLEPWTQGKLGMVRGWEASKEEGPQLRAWLNQEKEAPKAWQLAQQGKTAMTQAAYFKDKAARELSEKTGLSYDRTNALIKSWAEHSSDNQPDSVALQMATARFAGDTPGTYLQAKYDLLEKLGNNMDSRTADADRFVRGMYDQTQSWLKDHGVESMYVFRGAYFGGGYPAGPEPDSFRSAYFAGDKGSDVRVGTSPLSSWSMNKETAQRFAYSGPEKSTGYMMSAKIPARHVMGLPFTGVGSLDEMEVVVMGSRDHEVHVLRLKSQEDRYKT